MMQSAAAPLVDMMTWKKRKLREWRTIDRLKILLLWPSVLEQLNNEACIDTLVLTSQVNWVKYFHLPCKYKTFQSSSLYWLSSYWCLFRSAVLLFISQVQMMVFCRSITAIQLKKSKWCIDQRESHKKSCQCLQVWAVILLLWSLEKVVHLLLHSQTFPTSSSHRLIAASLVEKNNELAKVVIHR